MYTDFCTHCVGKYNFCCQSGCTTHRSTGLSVLWSLCLMSMKESLPSVCNWRLALGLGAYRWIYSSECSPERLFWEDKTPIAEGAHKSYYKISSFLPPRKLQVENHVGKKKNEVIYNRVVILGLGEPKQIIRWYIVWHRCIPFPPFISLCGYSYLGAN